MYSLILTVGWMNNIHPKDSYALDPWEPVQTTDSLRRSKLLRAKLRQVNPIPRICNAKAYFVVGLWTGSQVRYTAKRKIEPRLYSLFFLITLHPLGSLCWLILAQVMLLPIYSVLQGVTCDLVQSVPLDNENRPACKTRSGEREVWSLMGRRNSCRPSFLL